MRRVLPPLSALRAFEAAARHMSVKKAAAELGVTPTAVSHQLRELETACGQALFRRRPRPLALTEAGQQLYPVLRDGFDAFAAAIAAIGPVRDGRPLRVTATNAFAHRWLAPRVALWRRLHPGVPLEVVGTDRMVDLAAGEADIAIRYAFAPPPGLMTRELLRDSFWPMATPSLLASGRPVRRAGDLLQHTLIHAEWYPWEVHAPTWKRWLAAARADDPDLPATDDVRELYFVEELHALEAVIAGQGIGICSDVLAARELASGALVKAWDLPLPGFGFYLARVAQCARPALVEAFWAWALDEAAGGGLAG